MSKDGGPAFPREDYQRNDAPGQRGMTLRDYFAAKAMAAILGHLDHGIRPQDCIVMAEDSYTVADAMLAARAKP